MTPHPLPDCLLLLYTDRSDAVARALLERPDRFGREVVALSLDELVDRTTVGSEWRCGERRIDPARTAVVNRLVAPGHNASHRLASYFAERQLWSWLAHELARFAYATSLPTATSLTGCHGSLLDQWLDLPALVAGLRVPVHRAPWSDDALHGDVHRVDPWHLYSLGTPGASDGARDGRLAFVRPRGALIHVAQVGGLLLFAQTPSDMTASQQSYIVSFASAMAARSDVRILEHAFFLGDDGPPVFYSTCPFPVITGALAEYPELLAQGLADDIARRVRHAAA